MNDKLGVPVPANKLRVCICLLLVISAFSSFSQTQENVVRPSSLTKYDFIQLAHGNDSLLAVVNLFYRKRKEAASLWTVAGVTLPVSALISVFTVFAKSGNPQESSEAVLTTASVIFYATAIPGTTRLIRYSRKNLYRIIEGHQRGKPIPKKIKEKLQTADFGFAQ